MSDFKPGLEGVVAFETEIAEPDKDGGSLRYRVVDIACPAPPEFSPGRRFIGNNLGAHGTFSICRTVIRETGICTNYRAPNSWGEWGQNSKAN